MKWSFLLFACLFAFTFSSSAQMPDTRPAATLAATAPPTELDASVIYEIFPRTFSPAGDFNGITARLDTLQKLGVNVLWLMPINPLGEVKKKGTNGSPYAVRDYYAINPGYGTKADFHHLIDEAHRRHMKVIIDIVANHTSFDSVMMTHPDFYKHDAQGKVLSPYDWTDVAALDYSNPQLRRYMTDMLTYWIKDFHLDGFRCDAAGEIPTSFWEDARQELDRVQPGLLMLAEASKPELLRSAFNLDYSWPMLAGLNNILEYGAPASSLRTTLEHEDTLFPAHSLHMRMFDDHDEQRALARYGSAGSLAAAALVFTLDGVPMIYNGMEVSDPTESGAPALFENLKVWWQAGQMRPEFPAFYGFIIPFRKQHPAFFHGSTVWVHNSDEARVVSYLRCAGNEEFLITVNLSNVPFSGTVEVSGGWQEVATPRTRVHHNTGQPDLIEADEPLVGLPALSLRPDGFRIFQRSFSSETPARQAN